MRLFKPLECYDSLETLPMWRWYKAKQDGDLRQLVVRAVKKITEKQAIKLNKLFESL